MDLTGKCVIVTGSTKGIGAAVARKIVDAGGAVVINSSSTADAGRALVAELGESVATYVQGDVGADGLADTLVAAATGRWGRLDGIVNNAAVSVPIRLDDFESLTAAHWRKVLDTNLVAPFMLTRAALPELRKNRGWVINIGSIAGRRQIGSSLPYAVSKAALDHLTRTMARFLGPHVRVNGLAPGAVNSEWSDGLDNRKDAIRAKTPLARAAEPSEIAEACLTLAVNTFITGHVLIVDGGLSLVV